MSTLYLWVKAAHIIGVVCWFAGIFYLPRLFVYHAGATDAVSRERFQIMESKLYRMIMHPSMVVTLVFGIWALVASWQAFGGALWLWAKVAIVVTLLGYHHYCGRLIRAFAQGENPASERFFRIFNELPVLALILIVILVVVKPL